MKIERILRNNIGGFVSDYERGWTLPSPNKRYLARRSPYRNIIGFIVFTCFALLWSGIGLRIADQPPRQMVVMLLGAAIGCVIPFLCFRGGLIIGSDSIIVSKAKSAVKIILLVLLLLLLLALGGFWIEYSKQTWPNGASGGKLASFAILVPLHFVDYFVVGYVIGLFYVMIRSILKRRVPA